MRNHALKFFSMLSLALALAFLVPLGAAAQDQDQYNGDNGDDPPSRVARLSHTDGSVSFNPAGTDDWVAAVINRPITTGDKIWSDNGSRAELHIGSASLRIGGTTGFSFLNLTDNVAQVQLTEGTLRVRVKRLEQNETFEIDTPNLAFSVLRPGTYRVDVNEAGDSTVVSVMGGEGEVTGGGQAYSVHAGQTATFQGTDQLDADVQSYGNQDDFDQWCAERDHREDRSVSARYVSDDAIGYEDLDDYGGWRPVPDYGQVWFPHTTVVGWAPYRYGHWVYIAPWGYTWVEDEPWGFAPFHYGRWVTVGGIWGWVPCAPRGVGVEYVRPVYAPALVAWVGGPHFAVGVAVGGASNVGWFPLGPREVYYPSYRVSRAYVTNVNVYNTRVINRTVVNNYYTTVVVNKQVNNVTYVNQRVNGAVTATSTNTFVSGRSVARDSVRVDQREIARTQATYGGPAIPPTRQAVIGAGSPARSAPPARFVNRTVVARTAPPPAPVSFDRQQAAIRENGGRPLAVSQMRQIQTATPQNNARAAVRVAPRPQTVAPVQPRNTRVQTNQPNAQPNNQPNGQPNFNNRNVQQQQQNNRNVPQQDNRNVQQQQNNNVNRAPAATTAPPATNVPNTPANNANSNRQYNNRPPNARPTYNNNNVNPQLEQKQNQQLEQLRQRQDLERQKVEQRQVQEQQKVQQRTNVNPQQQPHVEQQQQRVQQQQQQQLQRMEQKHDTQQQQLERRQTQERVRTAPPPQQQSQPRNEKNDKNDKPPKQDRPH
jgi:hypothetical protein